MIVKLLTEHHLEFLSLKGGCTGLSKSTLVKMQHCWKSHVMAHIYSILTVSPIFLFHELPIFLTWLYFNTYLCLPLMMILL